MRRLRVVAALAAIGVLALAGRALWLRSHTVADDGISASGAIEATETLLAFRIAGRITGLTAHEGDSVRAGQVIARLDASDATAQVRQAEANLGAARARLAAARAGSRPQQITQAEAALAQAQALASGALSSLNTARRAMRTVTDLRAQVDAADAHLRVSEATKIQADHALSLARAGSRPDAVTQARAARDQARSVLTKAEDDERRAKALIGDGAVSDQQARAATTAREVASAALSQAEARLADLERGLRPQEIGQAEAAAEQADAALSGAKLALEHAREALSDRLAEVARVDAAEAQYRAAQAQVRSARAFLNLMREGSRPEDVEALARQADAARAALSLARFQLEQTVLRAPADGVVSTRIAEIGETVAPGSPVVEMVSLRTVWARVYVPERIYGRLALGRRARVFVDSHPGRPFAGSVVEIASEPEFTPKNVQTTDERARLVFAVKVRLPNPQFMLKPGMPADAVIDAR